MDLGGLLYLMSVQILEYIGLCFLLNVVNFRPLFMECFSAHPSFFSSETDNVDLRCPICPRFCSCFLQSVFFVLF